MNLLVRLIMPWRLPAAAALTLPVAVILNRFLAEDFVFILGILLLLLSSLRALSKKPSCEVRFSGRRNKVRERLLLICGIGDEPFRKHSKLPRHALPVSSDARL
jgi:hypothetical protein